LSQHHIVGTASHCWHNITLLVQHAVLNYFSICSAPMKDILQHSVIIVQSFLASRMIVCLASFN